MFSGRAPTVPWARGSTGSESPEVASSKVVSPDVVSSDVVSAEMGSADIEWPQPGQKVAVCGICTAQCGHEVSGGGLGSIVGTISKPGVGGKWADVASAAG